MSEVFGLSLPTSWQASRLKWTTSHLARGTAPAYSDTGAVRAISQAANQSSGLDWSRTRSHEYAGDPTKLKGFLRPSDILINSTGTGTLGRIGQFDGSPDGTPCMADGHVTVARFQLPELYHRFGYYWMTSQPFQSYIYAAMVVGATNQIELSGDRLADAPIPVPPIEEQRRIADFLDAETVPIDRLVTARSRQLELLDERIDALVLAHVGTSRIGAGNTGAPTVRIARVLSKLSRPVVPASDAVTAYRDGQVVARSTRRPEGYALSLDPAAGGQGVETGDVVIHGLDGFSGAIGTSESDGNCSPVYHVCAVRDSGDSHFYGRLLRILAKTGYLTLFGGSTRERAVDFRNWATFGRIPIPQVGISEQKEIGSRIDALRPIRGAFQKSSTLAGERKMALITAAVTGQIDVSTASGRGIGD